MSRSPSLIYRLLRLAAAPPLVPPPPSSLAKQLALSLLTLDKTLAFGRAPTDRRGVYLSYSLVLRLRNLRRGVALRSAVGLHPHRSTTSRVHRHAHYIMLPRQLAGGGPPANRLETGSTGKPFTASAAGPASARLANPRYHGDHRVHATHRVEHVPLQDAARERLGQT